MQYYYGLFHQYRTLLRDEYKLRILIVDSQEYCVNIAILSTAMGHVLIVGVLALGGGVVATE